MILILTLCRLVRGFATGGECAISATCLTEAAMPRHRGFPAPLHYVTLVGGHVLARATGQVPLFVIHVTTPIGASPLVHVFLPRNHGTNRLDAPEEMRRRKAHRMSPMGA